MKVGKLVIAPIECQCTAYPTWTDGWNYFCDEHKTKLSWPWKKDCIMCSTPATYSAPSVTSFSLWYFCEKHKGGK